MKRLIILGLLATCSAHAADFCRVVTFDSWITIDANGVKKENLNDNTNVEIYATENDKLFYVMVDREYPTQIDLFTYIGKMDDAHSVTTNDGVNVDTFAFYPHEQKFSEQDLTAPDEELRGKGYKFSTQTIFGHYKTCTIQQKLLMHNQYMDHTKSQPWINYK